MYPELRGRRALITGSGRAKGLGAAMARRLAMEGVDVCFADLAAHEQEMREVARETAQSFNVRTTFSCADMLKPSEIEHLFKHAEQTLGGVDIVVNNAGIGFIMKPIIELSLDEFDSVLGVNLRAVWYLSRLAAQRMIARGSGGRIINIASQAAKSGFPFASAYCASKHGLVGLTRVAAIEWGKHQITVNAICPNHVTTDLGAWQNEYFSKALGMSLEQYLSAMRGRIPLGRPGSVDDTANACAFLCSNQAQYMTGEAMNVSGGEEYH
jgi:meso-butanediol dehydrogenase/(S,S)-butanediol dehydrogenase/diacetyl reductase